MIGNTFQATFCPAEKSKLFTASDVAGMIVVNAEDPANSDIIASVPPADQSITPHH